MKKNEFLGDIDREEREIADKVWSESKKIPTVERVKSIEKD